MLCRFVFGFWWSIFAWCIWHHVKPRELHIWSVDKHTTNIVQVVQSFAPIAFENTSIIWLNSMNDQVNLRIVRTTPQEMGIVTIKQANMNVYETDYRDNEMEKYHIQIPTTAVDNMQLNLLQNDSHYSPFRRLEIVPTIEWTLGGDDINMDERVGRFKDGQWYEGRDPRLMGMGVLGTWSVGIVFLTVMRQGRIKRVFNTYPYTYK